MASRQTERRPRPTPWGFRWRRACWQYRAVRCWKYPGWPVLAFEPLENRYNDSFFWYVLRRLKHYLMTYLLDLSSQIWICYILWAFGGVGNRVTTVVLGALAGIVKLCSVRGIDRLMIWMLKDYTLLFLLYLAIIAVRKVDFKYTVKIQFTCYSIRWLSSRTVLNLFIWPYQKVCCSPFICIFKWQ